jgi:RHS repeat-associated protein
MGGLGQCAWRCDNTTRRTVWDGDQVLAEIRYPNGQDDQDTGLDSLNLAAVAQRAAMPTTPGNHPYGGPNTSNWAQSGRVLYVHAGGIDQPLGLLRMDYGMDFTAPTLIVPHADWRGAYEMGTFNGEPSNCHGVWMLANEVVQHDSSGHMTYPAQGSTADLFQDRCMEIDFPGKHMGMTRLLNRPTVAGQVAWMGSLVQDAQDASGLMYRRNRFYDPVSGRFTQEDPIGLAGGVNSYGFAAGDPVSYSDPYGLEPCRDGNGRTIVCSEPAGGPPVPLPGGRTWKPAGGPSLPAQDGTTRGRRWIATERIPGGVPQPGASWDPNDGGHWDVDNLPGSAPGTKGRRRFTADGEEVTHGGDPVHGPQQYPRVVPAARVSH